MRELNEEQKEYVKELFKEHYNDMDYCHHNLKPFLKEKGLIKEEFEVKRWVKYSDVDNWMVFINIKEDDGMYSGYGFCMGGEWIEDEWSLEELEDDKIVDVSPEEVKEALTKEAKKRGFKEGVECTSIKYGGSAEMSGNTVKFDDEGNFMFLGQYILSNTGKWSTIIEKEKTSEEIIKELLERVKALEDKQNNNN